MLTKTKVIIFLCIGICIIAITFLLLYYGNDDPIKDTLTDQTRRFVFTTTTQWDYQWTDKYATKEYFQEVIDFEEYSPIHLNNDYNDEYVDFDDQVELCKDLEYVEYNGIVFPPMFVLYYCNVDFWINDGFCDDECNHPNYNYDGGDCCLDIVNNAKCIDCYCYEDCSIHTLRFNDDKDLQPDSECYEVEDFNIEDCEALSLNDGICDDGCNNHFFDFDHQDCCLPDPSYVTCRRCICYANCTKMTPDVFSHN